MMQDDEVKGQRMPGAQAEPPSGPVLDDRLEVIRRATVGSVRRRVRAGLAARLAVGGSAAVATVVAIVVFLTSGLPGGASTPRFAGTPSASPTAGTRDPQAIANALLAAYPLPHGAKEETLPHPSGSPLVACQPYDLVTSWWSVPGMAPAELQKWLVESAKPPLSVFATGTGADQGVTDAWTVDSGWSGSYPTLALAPRARATISADGSGSTLIVEVETVPAGASCVSTGTGVQASPRPQGPSSTATPT